MSRIDLMASLTLALMTSACDSPLVAPASAANSTAERVPWIFRAGGRYRFRISAEVVRLPHDYDADKDDDLPNQLRERRALTTRTPERVQVDDVVTIDGVDARGASITETFEHLFVESNECDRDARFPRHLSIHTQLGPHGELISRDVLSGDAWELSLFAFSGLDLGYLPPPLVDPGDSWLREEVRRASCYLGTCEHRRSISYALHSASPCPERGECRQESAIEQEQPYQWTSGERTTWYDITMAPDDLQPLRVNGRSAGTDGLEDVSATWSIVRIGEPSVQPTWRPARRGILRVWSNPWTLVTIDGLHPGPFSQAPVCLSLPIGKHAVRIANEMLPYDETVSVDISEGARAEIRRDWCPKFPAFAACAWQLKSEEWLRARGK